jgi:hypothetical protein
VILRPADVADLPALVAVQQAGSLAALGHVFPQRKHPFPYEAILARWEEEVADSSTHVFVAERDV